MHPDLHLSSPQQNSSELQTFIIFRGGIRVGKLGQDTRTCVAPLSVCVAGHDGERAQRDGRQRGQAGRGQDLRRAPLLHLQDAQGPAAARGARGGVRPDARRGVLAPGPRLGPQHAGPAGGGHVPRPRVLAVHVAGRAVRHAVPGEPPAPPLPPRAEHGLRLRHGLLAVEEQARLLGAV